MNECKHMKKHKKLTKIGIQDELWEKLTVRTDTRRGSAAGSHVKYYLHSKYTRAYIAHCFHATGLQRTANQCDFRGNLK